jgi:hypothetical protein
MVEHTMRSKAIRRPFWVRRLKKKRVGCPSVIPFEGHLASSPEGVCDLFAEFKQRTYTEDVWVPSDPGPKYVSDDPTFGALQFTSDEVEIILQGLNVNKGSGPDRIPPIILKNCASAFALFQEVFGTSVFPDRW